MKWLLLLHRKKNGWRTVVLFVILLFSVCNIHASELPQLSSNSLISIVVCSPGNSYESTFGHSSIRIQDDSLRIDVAFNYGMYDPDQSFFFYKALLGTLESSLEGEAFYKFAQRYHSEGRGIKEYYLDLTPLERQQMWEYLNKRLLTDERSYKFNVTLNNCTTHIGELLIEQLNLDKDYYKSIFPGNTYRDFEMKNPMSNGWSHLLFNLVVGANADKSCAVYYSIFSPKGLIELLETISTHERSLVIAERELFPAKELPKSPNQAITILVFSVLLFISLLLLYIPLRQGKTVILFDKILFIISGLVGLFFLSLMLFSEIPELRVNYNIAWALPTNIILAFLIKQNKSSGKLALVLARLSGISIACFLILSPFLGQYIPAEAYLFSATLLVRLYIYTFNSKQKTF